LAQTKNKEPQISDLLSESLYVDDFVGGANDIDQAFEVFQKSWRIMSEGEFNLRKWNTNSSTLQERIVSAIRKLPSSNEIFKSTPVPEIKILGLKWVTDKDELHVDVSELIDYLTTIVPTKRSLLKFSAKLFDPLGFLSPFVVKQKMQFQHLCCNKVNWDDNLEGETLQQWNQLPMEIKALSQIRVSHCNFDKIREMASCQLHGFSDASERAFAAVVYLHIEYKGGLPDVCLVASKTRVAPVKKIPIPRLELLGATILARLMDTLLRVFNYKMFASHFDRYYWTDSYTILCWIKNSQQWKQYVRHRVDEIHRLSNAEN